MLQRLATIYHQFMLKIYAILFRLVEMNVQPELVALTFWQVVFTRRNSSWQLNRLTTEPDKAQKLLNIPAMFRLKHSRVASSVHYSGADRAELTIKLILAYKKQRLERSTVMHLKRVDDQWKVDIDSCGHVLDFEADLTAMFKSITQWLNGSLSLEKDTSELSYSYKELTNLH